MCSVCYCLCTYINYDEVYVILSVQTESPQITLDLWNYKLSEGKVGKVLSRETDMYIQRINDSPAPFLKLHHSLDLTHFGILIYKGPFFLRSPHFHYSSSAHFDN